MRATTARRIGRARKTILTLSLIGFVWIFFFAGSGTLPHGVAAGGYFALDPLILLDHLLTAHRILILGLLGLVPVFLTLFFGRVFCGWLCPFGALHEFFSWLAGHKRKPPPPPPSSQRRVKYLLLFFLAGAGLAGTNLLGWFDPLSWLSRAGAAALIPAFSGFLGSLGPGPRFSIQPVLVGSIFLILVLLNIFRRKFFCNSLCPLGALFGLTARAGFWRLQGMAECEQCGACSRGCPYGGGAGTTFNQAECITCLRCAADCPEEGVRVGWAWPGKPQETKIDLGRRHIFGTVAAGVTFGLLPLGSVEARTKAPRHYLRPPGAVKESDFLDRCVRCGQCMQACPTSFIQPSLWETSFDGIWSPVLKANVGYCAWSCRSCTLVCPTGAIQPLTVAEKQRFKVGTATIDQNRCFTYADGFNCTVCVDRCPIPEKPLRFRDVETYNYRGQLVKVHQVYVVPNHCTGCGICEYVCPRSGGPGIVITPEDEDREAPGN